MGKKLIFSLLFACFLAGCGTPYQEEGFFSGGGYKDFQVTKDTFVISFRGNAFTSKETVLKYSLRRAAEITLQHGYSHFVVLGNEDTTKQTRSSTYNANTCGNACVYPNSGTYQGNTSAQAFTSTINKPGNQITIKCFSSNSDDDGINAAEYLRFNPY